MEAAKLRVCGGKTMINFLALNSDSGRYPRENDMKWPPRNVSAHSQYRACKLKAINIRFAHISGHNSGSHFIQKKYFKFCEPDI